MAQGKCSWVNLIGRILLSAIFILSGLEKIKGFSATVGMITGKHVPLPAVATVIVIIIEVLGGLMVLSGFQAHIAAWVLFFYLIPTTLLFHNFWTFTNPGERMDMTAHFLKNIAIMGGLLILASQGAGACSRRAADSSKQPAA